MKKTICILTQDEKNRSCDLLKAEMKKLGYDVVMIQYENERASNPKLSWSINAKTGLLSRGDEALSIKTFDGVMVRAWGTAPAAQKCLEIFEQNGVLPANSGASSKVSISKVETAIKLSEQKVPMPRSQVFSFSGADISAEIKDFAKQKWPIVIKPDYGTCGESIKFPKDAKEALAQIDKIKGSGHKGFVLQEFVETSSPVQSYRILVVGGKAVAGMRLTAKEGSLVTNTSQGSSSEVLKKDADFERLGKLAVQAAKAIGMECCSGVDLLRGKDGELVVLEVNDSPKISTLEDNHKVPLASMVAQAFSAKLMQKDLLQAKESSKAPKAGTLPVEFFAGRRSQEGAALICTTESGPVL